MTTEELHKKLTIFLNCLIIFTDLLIHFDIKKGLNGDLPRLVDLFNGLTFAAKLK